ncbi:MAG: hypothetical protein U5L96_00110 [Owenweeksia sp.]|nr:hypothetical protein [Owenweeksia sp.]
MHLLFDAPLQDSPIIHYQILALPLNKSFFHKDTSLILPDYTLKEDKDLYVAQCETYDEL